MRLLLASSLSHASPAPRHGQNPETQSTGVIHPCAAVCGFNPSAGFLYENH